jgi:hypothetical protein
MDLPREIQANSINFAQKFDRPAAAVQTVDFQFSPRSCPFHKTPGATAVCAFATEKSPWFGALLSPS